MMNLKNKLSLNKEKLTLRTSNKQDPGSLIIVATPIGNMGDFSDRAKITLENVDVVAAEDTRNAKKLALLSNINLKKIVSYNDNSSNNKKSQIMNFLKSGMDVALISDAGMPLISDPGYKLVSECLKINIQVKNIPGPSSVLASLVVSGLPTDKFFFAGFPPKKKTIRRSFLISSSKIPSTTIWFESPKRLIKLLKEIKEIFGNRNAVVTRELTKLHEEIIRDRIEDIIHKLSDRENIKGEVVLVVSPPENYEEKTLDSKLLKEIEQLLKLETFRNTVDMVVAKTGISRNLIYKECLTIKKNLINKTLKLK